MMNGHHLFGLFLLDFFTGSPYVVELEKDLSLKKQFLDVVILRRDQDGAIPEPLPDGLDNLATHNLLSYKSLREAFDGWTVKELIGHYVNYRKQESPSFDRLLPERKASSACTASAPASRRSLLSRSNCAPCCRASMNSSGEPIASG